MKLSETQPPQKEYKIAIFMDELPVGARGVGGPNIEGPALT